MDAPRPVHALSPTERAAVATLADACAAADGTPPLNEEALLALGRGDVLHWLLDDGAGYAQWHPGHGTAQLCVHPGRRRADLGTALLDAVRSARSDARVWAFGDLPAARALASTAGLVPVRGLLRMGRPVADAPTPTAPDGVVIRAFTDADADAFLATNAAAFAGHPEQGSFSAADLAARREEAWFDPEGLLLAVDDEGVAGFHWTKVHGPRADGQGLLGEVYVLGVHPRAAGRRLGGVLLDAGLAHLVRVGCTHVLLYVDEGNAAAVRLYTRDGFAVEHVDRLYGPPGDGRA